MNLLTSWVYTNRRGKVASLRVLGTAHPLRSLPILDVCLVHQLVCCIVPPMCLVWHEPRYGTP